MKTLTLNYRDLNHQDRGASLFEALGALVARIEMARRIRRDTARLQSMNDHMLHDIGLHRGDIRDALRHGRDWRIVCR